MTTAAKTQNGARTRDLTMIALMAALTAVCAWITIPFSLVPFTLQTFAVFTALALLGGRRGTASIVLYLCLGLVGLPVFSGFSGGVGALLGPSGGYLLGFVGTGLVYWAITAKLGERLGAKIAGLVLGLAVVPPGVHRAHHPLGGPGDVRLPLHPRGPGQNGPGPGGEPPGGEGREGVTAV